MSYDLSKVYQKVALPSPLESYQFSFWKPTILIKRDDLIHPKVSGNKWRKLKGMVEWASHKDIREWVSFGGPFSNHILALSYVAHWCQIPLTCYIRGEKHYIDNPTLREVKSLGVNIHFVPRHQFRMFIQEYQNDNPKTLIIPEGGSHPFSSVGLKELMDELRVQVDLASVHSIWVGCGTGGTVAGIFRDKPIDLPCFAICAVKDLSIPQRISNIASKALDPSLRIVYPQKSMGYRKLSQKSLELMEMVYRESGLKLDPIYTIKLFNQVDRFLKKNSLRKEDKILIIHTGGLQGLAGYAYIHDQQIYTS